jgi:protein TonB
MSVSTSSASLFQPGSQNRTLLACVLASLLMHAVLLWLFPGIREGAPAAARVLTATLFRRVALPEPMVPEAVPRPPQRPRPSEVKPVPEPQRLASTSAAPQAPAPRELPVPAPAPPLLLPPAQTANAVPAASFAAAAAPLPQESEAPPPPLAPLQAAARTRSVPDAGNLDQYRLALIGAARKYKRYPALAVENGWSGKVEVRLVIGADGMVESALVRNSSGYDILDNQALDMIRKAKPLTPIPPALRGREFSVDIPVIFDLQTG